MSYDTVFTISLGIPPELIASLAVPLIFFLYMLYTRNLCKKGLRKEPPHRAFGRCPIWICGGFAIVWIFFLCLYLASTFVLVSAYRSGKYEIAEGEVIVHHRCPKEGHDIGDIIVVDETKFIVDPAGDTNAYGEIIAEGGVLDNGVYAKLYHYKGKILRIDIRRLTRINKK